MLSYRNTALVTMFILTAILLPTTASARFISVDPKASKYPSISPYAYVLNNPIRKVDPNGEEQFDVVVDVYIPFPSVMNFAGDNRGPSLDPKRTSRMVQTASVESDPNISQSPILNSTAETGTTTAFLPFAPYVATGKASTENMTTTGSRTNANGGDNATVNINGSASNPLIPAPAIDYSFQITLTPGQAPSVSGSHDGFPAYTVTVLDKNGKVVGTYQYTPQSESEVGKLFPPPFSDPVKVDE